MKVALFQHDIEWLAPEFNMLRIGRAVGRFFSAGGPEASADLVVLPEMFATGFRTDPRATASGAAATLEWMRRIAARHDAAVAGSAAVEESGRYYNRFYFVRPDGGFATYDKRHLFSFGGEDRFFTAGRGRVVVGWRGVRILLQVCYDLRFPVFARCRDDYDMIVCVAQWPAPRIGAWNTLLRARAIENQCYVAGVNRVGSDPSCEYTGGTALIDPRGITVASCPDGAEAVAVGEVDLDSLRAFRRRFPALADRDGWRLE